MTAAPRGGGPDFRKQQLDEIRGQRCGRLVEHQHFRFDSQRFGELDELTLCDADFGHARPRTNGAADALELSATQSFVLVSPRRSRPERPTANSRATVRSGRTAGC